MEDMEMPTEQAQEDIHHHAKHSGERWISWVALSSALLAALAAVTVLLAGKHANEAMLLRSEANDKWSFFQSKSIKAVILKSKIEAQRWAPVRTLTDEEQKQFGEQQNEDRAKLKEYDANKEEIKKEGEDLVRESEHHMHRHEIFAYGVTMFQVAIAVAAISVLSKRPPLWYVGLLFGGVGAFFMVRGFVS